MPEKPPPTKTEAFLKGGCGCLLAFAAVGAVALLLGGGVRADPGGLICLFVGGGLLGLGALAIYNRGRRDGGGGPPAPPPYAPGPPVGG